MAQKNPTRPAAPQPTCFVVTGFGNKTDYATGRVLNLNKTFELLVQPACDKANVNCFRAIDANITGSIDEVMYRWIYQADLVIADLSTLNANAFYELGVRHAQRPNTTIIIAESRLIPRLPFDLKSFVVYDYEHGGDTISPQEQARFVQTLAGLIGKIATLESDRQRSAPQAAIRSDSPVFTFLKGMRPPVYKADSFVPPPRWVPLFQRPPKPPEDKEPLSSLIDRAEAAKKDRKFAEAIAGFSEAIDRQLKAGLKQPDDFLVQRLALVTYKHGERTEPGKPIDKAIALAALDDAQKLLNTYCQPTHSNDPETLGLCGAIAKRRYDHTDDLQHLDRAIWFYERGFYVKRDHYNGINAAFMYTLRANRLTNRFDAIVSYGHANLVRKQVVEICLERINDRSAFSALSTEDQGWLYLSLAEAYQGLGRTDDQAALGPMLDTLASAFGKDTYGRQKQRLQQAIDEFNQRVRPQEVDTSINAAAPAPAPTAAPGTASVRSTGGNAIVIEPNLLPGRTVRSVEVHCKVEYT